MRVESQGVVTGSAAGQKPSDKKHNRNGRHQRQQQEDDEYDRDHGIAGMAKAALPVVPAEHDEVNVTFIPLSVARPEQLSLPCALGSPRTEFRQRLLSSRQGRGGP